MPFLRGEAHGCRHNGRDPSEPVWAMNVAGSSGLERTFGETRRRAKVIGRLRGETSCLTMVWAVLDRASRGWRGLTMTADGLRLLQDLRRSLLEPPRQPGTHIEIRPD
jgi:hypothetical protein